MLILELSLLFPTFIGGEWVIGTLGILDQLLAGKYIIRT